MVEPAEASSVHGRLGTSRATVAVLADDPEAGDRIEALLSSESSLFGVRVEAAVAMVELCGGDPPEAVVLCCAPDRARDAIKRIAAEVPSSRMVLVVPTETTARVLPVRHEHVQAVVHFDCLEEALTPTVEAVLAEQAVVPRLEHRGPGRADLSQPERQVLRLATQGCSNEQISTRLSLETAAVKTHLSSAFAKLAARPGAPKSRGRGADWPARESQLAWPGEDPGVSARS